MRALLISAVVRDGEVHVCEPNLAVKRQRAARDWGDGTALKIRIEPEEDAIQYAQYKHLYGHLYTPWSARNGDTVADLNVQMKTQFMPDDGRMSLTELTREELKQFTEAVEQYIRENDPAVWEDCCAAMELYDRRTA